MLEAPVTNVSGNGAETGDPKSPSHPLTIDAPPPPGALTALDATQADAAALEARLREELRLERERLLREEGLEERRVQHFKRPREAPFTADQRARTTLLFGGLTWKHERLIQGAWEGLGYRTHMIPTPDVRAFQLGKEYGNNGQCNPTYFTVGNLVQYLQGLEAQGLTREEIIDRFVFITAGACGPCRFGMYEAEYRLALHNAGFDGFRVILFQQSGGFSQSDVEAGLVMNVDFFLAIVNALDMGDLVNELATTIRPYEVRKGETDEVLNECVEYLYEVLRRKRPFTLEGRVPAVLAALPGLRRSAENTGKYLDQLLGNEYVEAMREVHRRFSRVEVDFTRVKPIVKVTGEFWAQTTEGDGNFNMFRFLEREGAQILVEPIATWINYMIHQAKQKIRDRKGLKEGEEAPSPWRLDRQLKIHVDTGSRLAKLTLAEAIFKREFDRLREALGGNTHGLTDQYELQRLGHPYYNSRAGGGEGHLEVAKNIYYMNRDLAHMVLSLKPFGCMPSTQSDGAQSAVVAHHRDMIYLPIETSGEGEINAHSRVQMALGEARAKAKGEFTKALADAGVTLEEIREHVAAHPELRSGTLPIPRTKGVIGIAANFVLHVAGRIRAGADGNGRAPAAASQARA